ncbi:hypothetical protein CERZMDRAFT_93157 [Cercospora zeae-maydis SCOH1-5]|uniref:Uncharacterized protein n=1 Tax=Cercospora zeae-maydis SCOH1-5 TaxID=717836 RepID=A0A6A6FV42_9PEZI|nr:hypothetical protein CERZMDRAFT_93157 [Cercospora zeae-maydis SCOH1-5]
MKNRWSKDLEILLLQVTAPSGRPRPHRCPGAHETRRDTQPVDPVERIEEYYTTGRHTRKRHPTDKIHRKRPKHTGNTDAPPLIIEERTSAARKSDLDHAPGSVSENFHTAA